jgi:hypothetical protein
MSTSRPAKSALDVDLRKLLIIAALLVAGGAAWALWHRLTHPPPAWMVRWQVQRYLKKQSQTGNFRVDFPFPTKAEMAAPVAKGAGKDDPTLKGQRTGKDFDTLARLYLDLKLSILALERVAPVDEANLKLFRDRLAQSTNELAEAQAAGRTNTTGLESRSASLQKRVAGLEKAASAASQRQAQQVALEPITADLWDFQRTWEQELAAAEVSPSNLLAKARAQLSADLKPRMEEAKSYAAIYQAIGQKVWVGARLLDSGNPAHRRMGVGLAMEASRNALDTAENGWLAARICEGYVWPNLAVATDSNRRSPFNLENLLEQCADVFRANDEVETTARNYQMLLAHASTPQRADAARAQIAMTYFRNDFPEEALYWLRQIKATNDFQWALRWMPRLELQLR